MNEKKAEFLNEDSLTRRIEITEAESEAKTEAKAEAKSEALAESEMAPASEAQEKTEMAPASEAQEKTEMAPVSEAQEKTEAGGCGYCAAECGTERHKVRTTAERKALMRRLSIIEGQIRGIRGMLERDVYCIDILTQVSAANCALNSFSRELLTEHMKTCVASDIREGDGEKLEELLKILPKLMK